MVQNLLSEKPALQAIQLNPQRASGPRVYEEWREALSPSYETIALDGGASFQAFNTAYRVHDLVLVDSYISGGLYKRDAKRIEKLLEIGELYRDTLKLDAMALTTMQRILEIDPHHWKRTST